MRIANLILNILSQLVALMSLIIPSSMSIMMGIIGALVYTSSRADQDVIEAAWIFVLVCMIAFVFVVASFIIGIVACVKGKTAKTKTYVTLQSFAMGFALLGNALAIGMCVFINDTFPLDGMEDMYLFPSLGIVLVIVTLVITIVYGCTHKNTQISA